MMKRMLSLVLVVALLCGVLPLGAVSAAETEVAYPVEGGNIYFDPATGTVTDVDATVTEAVIPEQIEGVTVTAIGVGAFSDFGNEGMALKRVVLPETVTEIGAEAFYLCKTLEEINIPSGVEVLPLSCFYYCESLTNVHLSEGLKTIEDWAFMQCTSLAEIDLPEGLETLEGGVFENCTALTELSLPESVNSVHGGVLYGTPILDDESNWTGDCLYLDNWLVSMKEETEATELQVQEGTIGIAGSVGAYIALEKVELPEGLKYISVGAFMGCDNLLEIVFPESLEKIESTAFAFGNAAIRAFFKGDAPEISGQAFYVFVVSLRDYGISPYMCMYYIEGKEGWTSPTWNGYPTAIWEVSHEHDYAAVVTAPTCTEEGYTTYTCQCGDSYIGDQVAALGHNFEEGTCTRCGEKQECAHSNTTVKDAKEATCTEDGYTGDICCADCGLLFYTGVTVNALGHDYQAGKCARCGEADPSYKPDTPHVEFEDVPEAAWYKEAVDYAVANGLMNGVGNNMFEPEDPMTRAMLVTVLWRYAGEPDEGKNEFTDVADAAWYAKAVAWAAENGVVTGVGDGKFDPDGKITREQMATILYRYSSAQGMDTSGRVALGWFPDGNKVSAYAVEALSWAVAEGLITGTAQNGKTYLDPQGSATRAQVATILMRYIENVIG